MDPTKFFFETHALDGILHLKYMEALQTFHFGGCVEDINEAVDIAQQALASLPDSFPGHDTWLTLLVGAIIDLFPHDAYRARKIDRTGHAK